MSAARRSEGVEAERVLIVPRTKEEQEQDTCYLEWSKERAGDEPQKTEVLKPMTKTPLWTIGPPPGLARSATWLPPEPLEQ